MSGRGSFNYDLPVSRIADWPKGVSSGRSKSKLLWAKIPGRGEDLSLSDCLFEDLPRLLRAGDILVLNDTKVLPYRFFAKIEGRNTDIEVLLQPRHDVNSQEWEALLRPMRKVKPGDRLVLAKGLVGIVGNRTDDGRRAMLEIRSDISEGKAIEELLMQNGNMPIPPYIRKGRAEREDRECYQTVYAKHYGSVAAPTAGLHFTEKLFSELESAGIGHSCLTLHVGPASFMAVDEQVLSTRATLPEYYRIPASTMQRIIEAKNGGGRVVAVGTTSVKALETEFSIAGGDIENSLLREDSFKSTSLFISFGYEFKIVDAIVTNFHQPSSTHLHLISAFAGEDNVEQIYRHALCSDYRFLSYGDAVFLDKAQGGE
ncbi:MAG: tRNA preQ1(34) S-adenosylmethionine ribosyltransferase-isomerase QueA [Deltaproteobacteria bacterium]|nr:tRNA preQ1(34) S-adenosylmethionine ribosyltransferase-isomerase QueA [Deltaproteobacteria bacterium]